MGQIIINGRGQKQRALSLRNMIILWWKLNTLRIIQNKTMGLSGRYEYLHYPILIKKNIISTCFSKVQHDTEKLVIGNWSLGCTHGRTHRWISRLSLSIWDEGFWKRVISSNLVKFQFNFKKKSQWSGGEVREVHKHVVWFQNSALFPNLGCSWNEARWECM